MSVQCGVIKDLLPLYIDGVTTEDTNNLIENHLKTCASCQHYHQEITQEIPTVKIENQNSLDPLKKIKRKIKLKNIVIGFLSIIFIGIIFLISASFATLHRPVAYQENIVTVIPHDEGHVTLQFEPNNSFIGVHSTTRIIIQDGIEMSVVYFHFTESFWSRHFSRVTRLTGDISFGQVCVFNENALFGTCDWQIERPVAAVYYFPYSIAGVTDAQLREYSVLVWER